MRYLTSGAMVLTISLLAACASEPVQTPVVPQSYLSSWQATLAQHQLAYAENDRTFRDKLASRASLVFYSWDDYASIASAVSKDLWLLHEPAGREAMRQTFIDYMASNPSAGDASSWFRAQMEAIDSELGSVADATRALLKEPGGQRDFDTGWLQQLEGLSVKQGTITGKARELFAVYEEAEAYFTETQFMQSKGKENTPVDLQQSSRMVALAEKLQQSDFQKRLSSMLARPRNCVKYANKLTCN